MTSIEELQVIGKVLSGDSDAFGRLVEENQKNVYNLAYRMTGNEQDAFDVSQEVFIKAYSSLASFRGGCKFSVWLYKLTYNQCIDFQRKQKRRPAVSLSVTEDDEEQTELDIPDVRYSPEDELERRETVRAVSDALDQISPEHRAVIVMREINDMSYDEIADTLNISVGTVKSRISRARKQLAKILIKNGTFPPGFRHDNMKGDEYFD